MNRIRVGAVAVTVLAFGASAAPAQEAATDAAGAGATEPGGTGDALASLDTALEETPGDPELLARYDALVEQAWRAGNLRDAKYGAVQIARMRPGNLDDEYRVVRILLQKGDRDEAERYLRRMIEDRPSLERPVDILGELLFVQGRYAEVLEIHAACLREHPGRAASLHRRASLLIWELGDLAAARVETERMRSAAGTARNERVTAWLRDEADRLDALADQHAADRERLRDAQASVRRWTWATALGWVLVLAAGWWWTRVPE